VTESVTLLKFQQAAEVAIATVDNKIRDNFIGFTFYLLETLERA